jgi:type VI protein secretion system component VasF
MRVNDRSALVRALLGDADAQAALRRARDAVRAWEERQRREVLASVGWCAAFMIAMMLGVALVLAVEPPLR